MNVDPVGNFGFNFAPDEKSSGYPIEIQNQEFRDRN